MSNPNKDNGPGSMAYADKLREERRKAEEEERRKQAHKDYLQAMRDSAEKEARKIQNLMPPPEDKPEHEKPSGPGSWLDAIVRIGVFIFLFYMIAQMFGGH
jgi:hypothetical protein